MKTAARTLVVALAALVSTAALARADKDGPKGPPPGYRAPDGQRVARHPPPPAGWAERCPRHVARAFQDVMRAADALADEIDHVDDRRERRRLEDDLEAMLSAVDAARDAACAAAPPPAPPPPPSPPPQLRRPAVLSQPAFAELVSSVKAESFDDGKQRVIDMAVSGEVCVTVEQVSELMATQSFTSAKTAVAKRLLPRLVDKERAFTLNKAFSFSSDREEFAEAVRNTKTLPFCETR